MKIATSYHILINEAQRKALLELIQANKAQIEDVEPTMENNIDPITGEHPLKYWIDMLTDLPTIEAESPGILNGFCL